MIDEKSVKAFWDSRAETFSKLPYESIANLEQDPEFLELKIQLETQKVFDWIGDVSGQSILDLGAGVGQWTFRFAQRGARRIDAVEYSEPLAEIGRKKAKAEKFEDVSFIVSSAEEFQAQQSYDIVFISGLFVYLNDEQVERLFKNLKLSCDDATKIYLRDGTGLESRHVIDKKHSEHLGVTYSAIYRTADEYKELFKNFGFELTRHENMFAEDVPLNKYPETRLRLYEFQK